MRDNYSLSIPPDVSSVRRARTTSNRRIRRGRAILTTLAHDLSHLIASRLDSGGDLGLRFTSLDLDEILVRILIDLDRGLLRLDRLGLGRYRRDDLRPRSRRRLLGESRHGEAKRRDGDVFAVVLLVCHPY